MYNELIALVILVGVILYQGRAYHAHMKNADIREQKLLDRIMSRDYAEYVQDEVAREQVKKPLTPEEI
jgi:hypothetical protein